MEKVNIPKDHIDGHFRYKREVAKVTHLNKRGGTTVIENTQSLSHDIGRPDYDLQNYLKRSLKRGVNLAEGKITIPGKLDKDQIEHRIEEYIKKLYFALIVPCQKHKI
jgi:translation initiation factor 2 beta subunit (eIF-2beta)/eIF-5